VSGYESFWYLFLMTVRYEGIFFTFHGHITSELYNHDSRSKIYYEIKAQYYNDPIEINTLDIFFVKVTEHYDSKLRFIGKSERVYFSFRLRILKVIFIILDIQK